jgi:hypothetical protein
MRLWTIIFYFALAIIFLGSLGVTLPYIFDNVNSDPNLYKNLNQNMVTYFIAILVSASLDYVMRLIDETVTYKKLAILVVCSANILALLMAAYILYHNSKGIAKEISGLAFLGVVLAYVMWWISNYKNSAFNISGPLGGDAEKPLTNG